MLRRLVHALTPVLLMGALLAIRVDAASSAEPAPSADGVGLLGEVTSLTPTALVVNDGRQSHAVAIRPTTSMAGGAPRVGSPVFVGAQYANGGLEARVVQNLGGIQVKDSALQELAAAFDSTSAKTIESTGQANQTCLTVGGFAPTSGMLNFDGCVDGLSVSIAPSFAPIELISIPGFSWHLISAEMSVSGGGGYYEFPFKFTAVDVATKAFDGWVSNCISRGYTVDNCPDTRPSQPGPGQSRQVEVNVAPVSTYPVPSYSWGVGAYLSMGFRFTTPVGCGSVGLDSCRFDVFQAIPAPLSSFSVSRDAPPLAPDSQLYAPPAVCGGVGLSMALPPVIGALMSPFDVLLCHHLFIDPPVGGFRMRIGTSGVDVVDFGEHTFDGVTPVTVTVTPRAGSGNSSANAEVTFSEFHYTANRHFKEEIRFRTVAGQSIGTPLLGDVVSSQVFIDTPKRYDSHKESITVPVEYAPMGATAIGDYAPQAVDAAGGSVIHVQGSGFKPVKYPDPRTDMIPGSGVTRVSICKDFFTCGPGDILDAPFEVLDDGYLQIQAPASAPSFALNPDGSFPASWSSHYLHIRAWGATIKKTLFYSPPPIITGVYGSSPSGTPVAKTVGGERIAIEGVGLQRVTEVLFGDVPASFVQCGVGDANQIEPWCAGFTGPGGDVIVTAPPHDAGTASVRVRTACFGTSASNLVCGTSAPNAAASVVYKAPPTLQAMALTSGLPAGGESVVLSGSGFTGLHTAVRFGSATFYCGFGQCVSRTDGSVTVVAPAGVAGTTVPVVVENYCADETAPTCGSSKTLYYLYLGTPSATTITPAFGNFAGGNQVVIEGSGFATATGVLVNGVSVPANILSDTHLSFAAPAGYPDLVSTLPGAVNVRVVTVCGPTAPGATSCGTSSPIPYEYRNESAVVGTTLVLDPVNGPVAGQGLMRATLRTSAGVPIPNRTVSFSLRGAVVGTAVTTGAGVATLTATLPALASGVYPDAASAAFAGDPVYGVSAATSTLTGRKSEVVVWGGHGPFQLQPPGLDNVKQVAAGYSYALALKNDGTVVGWGTGPGASVPAGLTDVIQISVTGVYSALDAQPSAALRSNGLLNVWGSTDLQPPTNLPPLRSVSMGVTVAAGVTTTGAVVAWGSYDIGTVPAAATSGVRAVSAGYGHVLALKEDGTVVGWGRNGNGQATPPAGLANVVAVATGFSGSAALRADGSVVSWGEHPAGHTFAAPATLTGVQGLSWAEFPIGWLADGTFRRFVNGVMDSATGTATQPAGLSIESFAVGGYDIPFIAAVVDSRVGTLLSVNHV